MTAPRIGQSFNPCWYALYRGRLCCTEMPPTGLAHRETSNLRLGFGEKGEKGKKGEGGLEEGPIVVSGSDAGDK